MEALLEYIIMIGWAGGLMKYECIVNIIVTDVCLTTSNSKYVRDQYAAYWWLNL